MSEDCLAEAEKAAEQVLNRIRPTRDSEKERRGVIDYTQRLLTTRLDCKVLLCGSVPLKTYLPDGDIDFTALKTPRADKLARDVVAVLEAEALNVNAEYRVKEIQFINAEVKVVKCLIQNFVVDITFNQLCGLSALCFFEEINRIVGRSHLFKRSIILVKLGATIRVAFLADNMVLHKFLEYYSQFDWVTYGMSVKGPVYVSSLPNIIVKIQETRWGDLMLREEFLNCIEMFSVPSRGLEEKPFQAKDLNIVDPLNNNKNIGRSVIRSSFYRMPSAFKHGASTLDRILSGPRDKVAEGVDEFFVTTHARHGRQHESSISHFPLKFGLITVFVPSPAFNPLVDLCGDYDSHFKSLQYGQSYLWPTSSDPSTHNQSSHMNSPTMYMEQNARTTRSYFQRGNDSHRERPPQVMGRNGAPENNNRFQNYVRGNGGGRNNFERNVASEVLLGRGRERNDIERSVARDVLPVRGRGRNNFERSIAHDVLPVRGRGRGRNNFERSNTHDVLPVQGRGRDNARNDLERCITQDVLPVRGRGRGRRRRRRRGNPDIHRQPQASAGDVNQTID